MRRFSLSKNHPNGLDSGIRVMDYEWLYDRLTPYYCHDNGRPGTDPVVLIKMVLIQHLFDIPSLRQTYREIQVNLLVFGVWTAG